MALTKIGTDGVKDDAITSGKIPANAVGSSELADNAVDTNAIQNQAVTTGKLANDAVDYGKLADGAVLTAKIANNAVQTAKIVDEAVTLAKLEHGTSSNDGKFLRANNGADPTFETVNTDLVSDTSPQLGGALDTNEHCINVGDSSGVNNDRLKLGDGEDLQVYHDGTDSYVTHVNGSGHLYLQGDAIKLRTRSASSNEVYVNCSHNAQVELYYNNNKAVETKDLSASGDSGEFGIKFPNKKAIQFHQNTIGIFTFSFSMSANTWTTMYTHDSYMSVTINVASIHNAGFSSATWIVSKSASGGNSLVRTGLNDAYGPARLEFRINGSDLQIRSSYGTYGYGLCLASYNMDGVRNISS